MNGTTGRISRAALVATVALVVLAGCEGGDFDLDLRGLANGFDTTAAVRQRTSVRPQPDSRGIISYPTYQVAIAQPGDTVADVAGRIGLPAQELARYNGLDADVRLRGGEVIALPRRVAEPSAATGLAAGSGGGIDISTLAGDAINRAGSTGQGVPAAPGVQAGPEPIQHHVARGETAYTIARRYNVSVRALADWNGLGQDLGVREGQLLLIPVAAPQTSAPASTAADTTTPEPPSAGTALPDDDTQVAATPASPDLGAARVDSGKLLTPVAGKIIRAYSKGKNDGIDIAADAGTPVRAAADGVVAAITRDVDQVPIVVLRHADNILTVYAGVDSLAVAKGDSVKRGQSIAKVRAGSPSFLHFEVRKGLASVDPGDYLG